MSKISGLDQLIYIFSKLPGLGPRSARRIILHLLQDKDFRLKGLIDNLQDVFQKVKQCSICGNIDDHTECNICSDVYRSDTVIAIVETVAELWAVERTKSFKGRYHVLGKVSGIINPRSHIEYRLPQLLSRCIASGTKELVIATNATLDGQTTAYFITEFFKEHDIQTTRLANGIPIGGELDYLDEGTLSTAFNKRVPFN
jgi:recombination protein RecR